MSDRVDDPAASANRELHFGNNDRREYPLPVLNTLVQTRSRLDPNAVEELKTSLVVRDRNGEIVDTDLLNAVSVADLDEKHARAYLDEINEARGTSYTLEEMASYVDDSTQKERWAFIFAGHTRKESMRQIGEEEGVNPNKVFSLATVYRNISYHEAARKQITENKHKEVKDHEEAELIVDMYKLNAKRARQAGSRREYTPTQCARDLGISLNRVNNALAYELIPDEVKKLVARGEKNGGVSYMLAVKHLSRYQAALRAAAVRDYELGKLLLGEFSSPEEHADHELFVFTATLLQRMLGARSKTSVRRQDPVFGADDDFDPSYSGVIKHIDGEIQKLSGDPKAIQLELTLDNLMKTEVFRHTRKRREESVATLGRTAAGILGFLADVAPEALTGPGVIGKDDARRLGKLFTEYASQ